jgi:hypothetical protein
MRGGERGTAQRRLTAFMDAASSRLQQISLDDAGERGDCARQVMATTSAWSAWENEFRQSLVRSANFSHRALQQRNLRSSSISWVHRSEPFRYLRDQRVRGEARRRLMIHFHGHHSLSRSLILEHGNYLRGVCSSACTEHIGLELLGDVLLEGSMRRYEALYAEYFAAYCAASSSVGDASRDPQARELLPLLKLQVLELRKAILEHPLRRDWLDRESRIRSATGETARLHRLIFNDGFDTRQR